MKLLGKLVFFSKNTNFLDYNPKNLPFFWIIVQIIKVLSVFHPKFLGMEIIQQDFSNKTLSYSEISLFLPSDLVRQVRFIEALCLTCQRKCRSFQRYKNLGIVVLRVQRGLLYLHFVSGLSYNLR